MGSIIEINDTLQITKKQGFPTELNIDEYLKNPITLSQLGNKVFEFTNKPKIRVYKQPPVRNFLVENIDGKWIYWGLCHILEITHDYQNQTTSGKFKITYLNSPDQMKFVYDLIDRDPDKSYL